jgi:hypothetical protein
VEEGEKTWQEWDDRVAYYKGSVEKEVELFERQDYAPPFYCIGTEAAKVRVRLASGDEYSLQFFSHMEASRFLEWLKAGSEFERPFRPGGNALLFGSTELFPDSADELKVMPVY